MATKDISPGPTPTEAAIVVGNARTARKALANAASGSYRRPKLVDPSKYDPDAEAEPVGAAVARPTRDGGPASG